MEGATPVRVAGQLSGVVYIPERSVSALRTEIARLLNCGAPQSLKLIMGGRTLQVNGDDVMKTQLLSMYCSENCKSAQQGRWFTEAAWSDQDSGFPGALLKSQQQGACCGPSEQRCPARYGCPGGAACKALEDQQGAGEVICQGFPGACLPSWSA